MGRSDTDSCSSDDCDTRTNYTSSKYTECSRSDSCERTCDTDRRSCDYDCGIKESTTPVGVWNLVFNCSNACTTTGSMEWINQIILNGDKTLNMFFPPDMTNNPFTNLCLIPGSGVWELDQSRKFKINVVTIAFRPSDGAPQAYVKIHLTLKLNRTGTRAKFCGEAKLFDLCDPKMCYPTDAEPICFTGCGAKVLEPKTC